MGWSDGKMSRRYQHVIAPVQKDAGERLGQLLWKPDRSDKTSDLPNEAEASWFTLIIL